MISLENRPGVKLWTREVLHRGHDFVFMTIAILDRPYFLLWAGCGLVVLFVCAGAIVYFETQGVEE